MPGGAYSCSACETTELTLSLNCATGFSDGGLFKARLSFPQDYPYMPPTMRFTSDMWHPNSKLTVATGAKIRLDYLTRAPLCFTLQSTRTERSAYPFCMRRARTRMSTRTRRSGGCQFTRWRRFSCLSSPCSRARTTRAPRISTRQKNGGKRLISLRRRSVRRCAGHRRTGKANRRPASRKYTDSPWSTPSVEF